MNYSSAKEGASYRGTSIWLDGNVLDVIYELVGKSVVFGAKEHAVGAHDLEHASGANH